MERGGYKEPSRGPLAVDEPVAIAAGRRSNALDVLERAHKQVDQLEDRLHVLVAKLSPVLVATPATPERPESSLNSTGSQSALAQRLTIMDGRLADLVALVRALTDELDLPNDVAIGEAKLRRA